MGAFLKQIRDLVNNNSAAVTIGAVVILIFALYYIISSGDGTSNSGAQGPIDVYYFDDKTGELFTDKSDKIAPFPSPAGGKAYRAYVFNCTACDGETDFIGYLEGFTDDHKELVRKMKESVENGTDMGPDAAIFMEEGYGKGRLISLDGKDWFPADSEEAMKITRALSTKCADKGRLKPCYPGR
jgi:hypothetical protein